MTLRRQLHERRSHSVTDSDDCLDIAPINALVGASAGTPSYIPSKYNSFLSHGIGPLDFLNKRTQQGIHYIACVMVEEATSLEIALIA